MNAPDSSSSLQFAATPSTPRYSWYVVFVLMLCFTLAYIDRQILSLLVGPIKQDLGISDTVVGLLQGFAFALFFAIMGLPFGRMVDTKNRRNLLIFAVTFWSLMTATCSIAKSFATLFLARMGVGVGEAALAPAALSIIADYFPKERLATALSVYSMGVFIGSGLALVLGGMVIDAVLTQHAVQLPLIGAIASWRVAFLIVGLPGLVLALVLYSVREPGRKNLMRGVDGQALVPSMGEVFAQIRLRASSAIGLALAIACMAMSTYSFGAWTPAFFIRVHHWTPGQAGVALGWIIMIAGCLGMLAGGTLCDYWQRMGKRDAPLRVGVIGACGTATLFPLALLMSDPRLTLALLVPAVFCQAMPAGSGYAALQLIFPNQLRGQVNAILGFIAIIVGLTLGPLLPGLFNDLLFKDGNMVGYSIAISIALAGTTAAILFRAIYAPYQRHYAMMHGER
jgi:MFS family permease